MIVRLLNRFLNKILHPITGRWIFLYKGFGSWKSVTDSINGKKYLVSSRWDLPKVVESQSADIVSLAHFLETYRGDYVEAVLAFVHSIPYTKDDVEPSGKDWAKTPTELLVTGKGDCEDLSILCTSLLRNKGYDAHLLWLQKPSSYAVSNHCTACINSQDVINIKNKSEGTVTAYGEVYYLIECTYPRIIGDAGKYKNWPRTLLGCEEGLR